MSKVLWKPTAETIETPASPATGHGSQGTLACTSEDYRCGAGNGVDHIDDFGKSLWDYFDIISEGLLRSCVPVTEYPGIRWFEGSRLNYAEHVFQELQKGATAIIHASEKSPIQRMDWDELQKSTAPSKEIFF